MSKKLPEFADAAFVETEVLKWLQKEELTPHQIRLRCVDSEKIIGLDILSTVLAVLLQVGKIRVTRFDSDLRHPLSSDVDRYPFTVFLRAA